MILYFAKNLRRYSNVKSFLRCKIHRGITTPQCIIHCRMGTRRSYLMQNTNTQKSRDTFPLIEPPLTTSLTQFYCYHSYSLMQFWNCLKLINIKKWHFRTAVEPYRPRKDSQAATALWISKNFKESNSKATETYFTHFLEEARFPKAPGLARR